ncbi:MAG: RNA polymerase sigma factor, partial [Alphaproteobacteria bacterium]
MRGLAGGDEAAARTVVETYARPIARFASGILNDPAEGEDIANEAILRLWRGAKDWRPEGIIAGWLRRSAYTLAIDRLRRSSKMVDDPDANLQENAVDGRVDPEDSAAGRQIGSAIEIAMSQLPERQR